MKILQRLVLSFIAAGGIYFLSRLLGQGRSHLEEVAIYAAIAVALVVLAYNLSKLLTERDEERTTTGLEAHKILATTKLQSHTATAGQRGVIGALVAQATRNLQRPGGKELQQNAWVSHAGLAAFIAAVLLIGGLYLLILRFEVTGIVSMVAGAGLIRSLISAAFDPDDRKELEERWPTAEEMEAIAAKSLDDSEPTSSPEEDGAEEDTQTATTPHLEADDEARADARWRAIAAKRDAMVEAALKEAERNFLFRKNDR